MTNLPPNKMVTLKDSNNTSNTDSDNLKMNATNTNSNVGLAKTASSTAAAASTATAPVTATVTTSATSAMVVVQPTKHDVLFGRGRCYQEHYGNQRFLRIVESNRRRYQKAFDRHIKAIIVNETIKLVEHEQDDDDDEEEEEPHYEVVASSTSGSSNMDIGQDGDQPSMLLPQGKVKKDSVVPIRARFLKQHKITTAVDTTEDAVGGEGGDGLGDKTKKKKKRRRRRKKKSKKNSGDGEDDDDDEDVVITWYEAPYDDVCK